MRKTPLGYWLIHIGHFYACQLVTKCGTRMLEPLYHDWICWDILRTSLANRIADTCSRFTNIKNKMNFFQGKRSILNKICQANDFRMHSYSESWMDGNRSSSNGQIYDDFETYVPISFGFWMETLILALVCGTLYEKCSKVPMEFYRFTLKIKCERLGQSSFSSELDVGVNLRMFMGTLRLTF